MSRDEHRSEDQQPLRAESFHQLPHRDEVQHQQQEECDLDREEAAEFVQPGHEYAERGRGVVRTCEPVVREVPVPSVGEAVEQILILI